jgi:DNA modification methylase
MSTTEFDLNLKNYIDEFSNNDKDYWSFRGKAIRENAHAYFQYPAMMVPQMQNALLDIILKIEPDIKNVLDPFVGSGTVLTETMNKGLNFTGQDINPLSILLCKAKKGPFKLDDLNNSINILTQKIKKDKRKSIEIRFSGLDKWFTHDIAIELSKIKRSISSEETLWIRRFFWVALAETIRLTSNSRTSTFKLHIRPVDEIENRNLSPINIFIDILQRNFIKYSSQTKTLEEKGYLNDGFYKGEIKVELGDSRQNIPQYFEKKYDLLITSPPYGDNKTTVPYGQCAYLPLQWIELKDIDTNLDKSCLSSTWEIDSRSLGGKMTDALTNSEKLLDISPNFRHTMKKLKNESRERIGKVASFCYDLDCCIEPILDVLKPNAYMIWIIGNRHVAKHKIPLDSIFTDLITSRNVNFVTKLQRKIPTKRMAVRNNIADTMGMETILILRKGDIDA